MRFDTEDILVGLAKSLGLRVLFGVYAGVVFFAWSPGFVTQLGVLAAPLSLWSAWTNHGAPTQDYVKGLVWPWLTMGYVLGSVWVLGGFWGLAVSFATFIAYRAWKYWDTVKRYKELGRMFREAYTGDSDE